MTAEVGSNTIPAAIANLKSDFIGSLQASVQALEKKTRVLRKKCWIWRPERDDLT